MQNTKVKKVVSIVLNVLVWVFLAFAVLVTILTFASQNAKAKDGVPSIFGKSIVTIQSNSMKTEDKKNSFKQGDLIIIEKITGNQALELDVGDVITYRSPIDINGDGENGDINTHRIVEKTTDAGGIVWFKTQGDNLEMCPTPDGYDLRYTDVVGVWEGGKLAGVGGVVDFLRSSLGFALIIVLPMALFFIYEVYNLIKVIMDRKVKKATEGISLETEEEIKRRAIEEYIASQKAVASTPDEQNSNKTEQESK